MNNYGYDMFIGICRSDYPLNQFLGRETNSWALSLSSGSIGNNNNWLKYAWPFDSNDILTVKFNWRDGELKFELNQEDFGIAFQDEKLKEDGLWFAVSILFQDNEFEIT